jgi:hypothetical protein
MQSSFLLVAAPLFGSGSAHLPYEKAAHRKKEQDCPKYVFRVLRHVAYPLVTMLDSQDIIPR